MCGAFVTTTYTDLVLHVCIMAALSTARWQQRQHFQLVCIFVRPLHEQAPTMPDHTVIFLFHIQMHILHSDENTTNQQKIFFWWLVFPDHNSLHLPRLTVVVFVLV